MVARHSQLLVVFGAALVCAGTLDAAPVVSTPTEIRHLHVLLVVDTGAKDLAFSLKIDRERMEQFLERTIPVDRYTLHVLEGQKANARSILSHYRNLRVNKEDGLLFYYAGHGAREEKTGRPFFDLKQGGPLFRQDVVRAMEAKGTDLVLLVTDCCSTPQKLRDFTMPREAYPRAKTLHPTVRNLIFQARGTIDVTAATDNTSWSDNQMGGVFTRSLCRMLRQPITLLDGDKDGFLTWREFYPQLRDETQSLFGEWRKEMIGRGERIEDRKQVPHAFHLGRSSALVAIENATDRPRSYRYRWAGQSQWNDVTLEAGERKLHLRALKDTDRVLPALETQFEGLRKPVMLKALEWTGNGEPAEPARIVRLRSR
ncbi:MAG: caspase family protein [Gemmataceae bacterium]